jgi:hypothetical protein
MSFADFQKIQNGRDMVDGAEVNLFGFWAINPSVAFGG